MSAGRSWGRRHGRREHHGKASVLADLLRPLGARLATLYRAHAHRIICDGSPPPKSLLPNQADGEADQRADPAPATVLICTIPARLQKASSWPQSLPSVAPPTAPAADPINVPDRTGCLRAHERGLVCACCGGPNTLLRPTFACRAACSLITVEMGTGARPGAAARVAAAFELGFSCAPASIAGETSRQQSHVRTNCRIGYPASRLAPSLPEAPG
jgi:hypothetical protein